MVLKFGDVMLLVTALEDYRQSKVNKLTASRHTIDGTMGVAGKKLVHRDDLMMKIASLEGQLVSIDRLLEPLKEEAHRLSEVPSRVGTRERELV